ncbi:MAG: hypothetical protein WCB63_20595 [Polyangiales bacterium]|jgi:hypothetical protein
MSEPVTLPGFIAQHAAHRPERNALVEVAPGCGWVSTSWGDY